MDTEARREQRDLEQVYDILAVLPEKDRDVFFAMVDRGDPVNRTAGFLVSLGLSRQRALQAVRTYNASRRAQRPALAHVFNARDELVKLYDSQKARYEAEVARETEAKEFSANAMRQEGMMLETLNSIGRLDVATGVATIWANAQRKAGATVSPVEIVDARMRAAMGSAESRRKVLEIVPQLMAKIYSSRASGAEVTDAG